MQEIKRKSNRGGFRPGAGRKPKVIENKAFEATGTSQGRTLIYMPGVEAKRELTSFDLTELRLKSRWLQNNFGIAARAIDGVARYTVGTGLSPQARTKNRDWNKKAEESFESKCGTAAFGFDVSGQVNFYEAQNLIVRQVLGDGDFFSQLMRSESGAGMMRFIGGEYIGGGAFERDQTSQWSNGIRLDGMGKPTVYRVQSGIFGTDSTDVPAADMIHFKRVHRHGYVRGVPALAHAVNHLHDMSDILAFTKGSFKLASQIAFILESAEAGKVGLGQNLVKQTAGNGQVTIDNMYPLAGHVQTKPGEKITTLANPHPGASFEPFMNYLIRDISWGIGISPEILWAIAGIGGANTRYVLADAQVFFQELQQLLVNQFCSRFWVFWIWHEIEAGRLSYPGEDWWRHDWIPPGRITVDFTKDGKLLADLVDRGLLSSERYYGMQGLDADTEEENVIRRMATRKKMVSMIAAEQGVELSVAECFPAAPGSSAPQMAPNKDQSALLDIEEMKSKMDAYGVGVRAGAITPQSADEDHFRKSLEIPPPSPAVAAAWDEDEGYRRPITLQGGGVVQTLNPTAENQ